MSHAEELLDSLVEYYATEAENESDQHIVIDNNRKIIVPDELKRIAVQYDHNMRTVTFDCPRYYDGRDMSQMRVYINIRGPQGDRNGYLADNVRVDAANPNVMHFDWTITRTITGVKGNLAFLVCIRKADSNGNEENHWNSELNTELYISEGMEYDGATITDEYPDIITQLLGRLDGTAIVQNIEPAEEDIPKVFFGSSLPQTKDDTVMSFRYISKTEDISGYCKTKAQGNSSMAHPKKNQTVKLYKDIGCTEKLKVDFKGWGKQNKFCFKANWIDLTHARNIVSARLWGDVVKSRANYTEIPELLRTSPNQGAVDGFPVKVYADGIYQGRYTINIPKDAWMANMDDELDEHCILCGESESALFTTEAVIDGTDWTDEVHDTVPDSIKNRWSEAIRFVMNSSDEEFVSGIGNYFDVESLIDYYLFGLASCHFDGFHKNQLYLTYDGMKWYASAYDMDSTWGLWWDASYFVNYDYYIGMANRNKLYTRLQEQFGDTLTARWRELRARVLSKENIINEFERFTDVCPPWLCKEDYEETTAGGKFATIPLKDTNNIQQIRDYIVNRLEWADRKMNGDENLIYSLKNVAFDGTNHVNTGVCLHDEPKEATIFIDLTASVQPVSSAALLWTAQSDDPPTSGIAIKSSGTEWVDIIVNGKSRNAASSWLWLWEKTRAIAITLTATGLIGLCKLKYTTGETETFTFPEMSFVATDSELVIGAKHNGVSYWDHFVGTINDLRIWNRAFSDEEINALLDDVSVP